MSWTIDTNILVRAIVKDDDAQSAVAIAELAAADGIVIPVPVFCELAWVLHSVYRFRDPQIAEVIAGLLDSESTTTDRATVEAGLAFMHAGGDFSDGVIAFDGYRLGGKVLLTFDRRAAEVAKRQGMPTRLLR